MGESLLQPPLQSRTGLHTHSFSAFSFILSLWRGTAPTPSQAGPPALHDAGAAAVRRGRGPGSSPPPPLGGDVQWLGGPWRPGGGGCGRAAGRGRGRGQGAAPCWWPCWRCWRCAARPPRRRTRGRLGSAGTSSAITTPEDRSTPGRRRGCPSPTTRCTSARPRVGAGPAGGGGGDEGGGGKGGCTEPIAAVGGGGAATSG